MSERPAVRPPPSDAPAMLRPSLRVPAARPPPSPARAVLGGVLLSAVAIGGVYFVVDAIRESRKTPFERAMQKHMGKEIRQFRESMHKLQRDAEKEALRSK